MRVQVTIEGISPLLMNRFTEANEIAVGSGTRPTFVTTGHRGTSREQAEPKAYKDADSGELYVPGPNVYAAIVAAGVFHKAGRQKITTQKTSLIPAGMWIEDVVCSLNTKHFEVDSRAVVIPATGGRIMCHRPRIDNWSLRFTLEIDESMFGPDLVRTIVDDAGKKVGLGDYRPSRKGPFGRFVVTEWKVLQQRISKAA